MDINPQLEKLLSFVPAAEKKGLDIKNPEKVKAFLTSYLESSKPINSAEYTRRMAKGDLVPDSEGGLFIEPQQQFVLKAKIATTGMKLFINVTSHPLVEDPSETEVPAASEREEAQIGVRLPMSVGDLCDTQDTKNRPARSVDVIVNPNVVKRIRPEIDKTDAENLNLFCSVLFGYLDQKYKLQLTDQFSMLKGVAYKGGYVKFQRVKMPSKKKVQLVSYTDDNKQRQNSAKKNTAPASDTKPAKMLPNWTAYFIFVDGAVEEVDGFNFDEDVIGMRFEIKLDLLSTSKLISQTCNFGHCWVNFLSESCPVCTLFEIFETG